MKAGRYRVGLALPVSVTSGSNRGLTLRWPLRESGRSA